LGQAVYALGCQAQPSLAFHCANIKLNFVNHYC
jgi:hypothetical protein